MMKKFLWAVLSLGLVFGFVGCNQKSGPSGPIAAYSGDFVTSVDITHRVGEEAAR